MALIEKKTIVKNEINYEKLAQAISHTNNEIDYERLAKAIVSASKAEEIESEKRRKAVLRQHRHKYHIIQNTSRKGIGVKIANTIRTIHGFLNYNEEQSETPVLTFELLKGVSGLFFLFVEVGLIIFGYFNIGAAAFIAKTLIERIGYCVMGFSFVLLGSVFRVIRLEVGAMKSRELINVVFSSLMAFIAALFTTLAFLKG